MQNLFNHITGKDFISIIRKYTLKNHGAHDNPLMYLIEIILDYL